MVKFSKQYEGQLIPEWKEAFVDYWKLKKDLKKFQLPDSNNNSPEHTLLSSLKKFNLFGHKNRKHRAIQVHKKLSSTASRSDMYETELLDQFADPGAVKEFFACLDFQLNKVNQFYKRKEKEFVDRGDSLKEQLKILSELKIAVKQQHGKGDLFLDSKEDASITCTISCEEDSVKDRTSDQEELQDKSTNGQEKDNDQSLDSPRSKNMLNSVNPIKEDEKMRTILGSNFNCQRKKLKINIPLTTPARTFSAISYLLKEDRVNQSSKKISSEGRKLHFNKTRLRSAEKMIRQAFVELHKGLSYLKTYRNLNMLAFIKILKKFDKVTGKQVLPIYLKVVETSYFNISDKEMKLTYEVEELFIKHFADDDRKKAMKFLKPRQREESHAATFFIGLVTGCFIALLAGYVIMAHITGMYKRNPDSVYMETVYPVFSLFSLLFLHLFLYGCNIFAWRKTRINYSFIFELAPTKELKYRDVFLICTTSMAVVTGVVLLHLSLVTKGYSFRQVQAIPGLLLVIFLLLLVCPLNIAYRSTRYRFLSVIRNIILSPFYKVLMLDFFMADQLCSQVPMLQTLSMWHVTTLLVAIEHRTTVTVRKQGTTDILLMQCPFYPITGGQCRWFDEGKLKHLANLGKYVSAMLAAGAKVTYEKDSSIVWLCVVIVISSAATVYQLYWDFVEDWGLLQINSKNPWLRNELILRRKIMYYISMGLNLILRLAWLHTVIHSSFEHVDYRVTGLFLAALEVIRRGQWNFYRLENEHLNNAGKFRAVKLVPLPFHEVDEED